jgi:hypothetical protein
LGPTVAAACRLHISSTAGRIPSTRDTATVIP